MARPKKPAKERKDNTLRIRLTREQRALMDRVADEKTSTWARKVLVKAARRRDR